MAKKQPKSIKNNPTDGISTIKRFLQLVNNSNMAIKQSEIKSKIQPKPLTKDGQKNPHSSKEMENFTTDSQELRHLEEWQLN